MKETIRLKDKEFELYIPEAEICGAIRRVAEALKRDVEGRDPLFVGIMNGAFMFVAELMKQMNVPYTCTFARFSSYQGTATTGKVREVVPLTEDVTGRLVVLLEDVVDTGISIRYVSDRMREQGAAEVKVATMLFKPDCLRTGGTPDYVGLSIPNDFIVGYGLDYDGLGRGYRDIYRIKS